MQLTIAVFDDRVVSVDVDTSADIETLKAILEAETGVPKASQLLIYNGAPLSSNSPLSSQGVQSGDLIMLEKNPGQPSAPGGRAGPTAGGSLPPAEAQQLLQRLRSMPQEALPPALRQAIATGDMATILRFAEQLASGGQRVDPLAAEEARLLALAEADPFNVEVQRRLEEIIQQRNVHEAYENAMEEHPEFFGSVHMLYVDTEVNNVPLKAFVDSGAQMTIMSASCAAECGLLRLLDKRFQGTAKGVGQSKILGRIHMAPLKVAGQHIPISITVLEGDSVKFLLGLDNLKRHQCSIDLKDNVLRFPSLNLALPFLAEHELPKDDLFTKGEEEDLQKAAKESAVGGAGASSGARVSSGGGAAPTAAPTPSPVGDAANAGGGGLPAGWEEKVQRLMALGFPRDQCEGALKATQGNEEMAGSMLFGGF